MKRAAELFVSFFAYEIDVTKGEEEKRKEEEERYQSLVPKNSLLALLC
jgi:hypothetical protein